MPVRALSIEQWSDVPRPVIGMLHLLPLPGSPRWGGEIKVVRDAALRDAEALAKGGAHGVMIENYGDVPFYPSRVPAETVAHLTAIARDVAQVFHGPMGINVLRNDGLSALAIAHAAGASFIRVNVLSGARVADQGLLQGIAHDLLRARHALGAGRIKILADVDVKHSAPLAARPIVDEVADTIERGLADGVIVSGTGTGKATDLQHVLAVKAAAGRTPVFIGSGVTEKSISSYLPHADGFIIGTAFKKSGIATEPVEADRVKAIVMQIG